MQKTILFLILTALLILPATAQEPTPTPDPYAGLRMTELMAREYGGGELRIEQDMGDAGGFRRYVISYPSDDLRIYGFMNIPTADLTLPDGTCPVIIAIHGYVNPNYYDTFDYTTRYADALARAGFLVLHPNLRGYYPSDSGDDQFRIGMAVDVLNLAALVRSQGGQPGALQAANPDAIGLWGHSMGGGIALRTITVDSDIRGAVLYGAMSGDEAQNYAKIWEWSDGESGAFELATPLTELLNISPIFYLNQIEAAVSVHHGELDETVPLQWSLDLCTQLEALQKVFECYSYPNQPHTFRGEGDQLFIQRTINFFNLVLR